jgi:hypothetical protein
MIAPKPIWSHLTQAGLLLTDTLLPCC